MGIPAATPSGATLKGGLLLCGNLFNLGAGDLNDCTAKGKPGLVHRVATARIIGPDA